MVRVYSLPKKIVFHVQKNEALSFVGWLFIRSFSANIFNLFKGGVLCLFSVCVLTVRNTTLYLLYRGITLCLLDRCSGTTYQVLCRSASLNCERLCMIVNDLFEPCEKYINCLKNGFKRV